jgi:hypothetical protein
MILLDHCTPRRYLRLVQAWGYEADITINHIPQDANDTEVIALAQKLDAVLLTIDLDFSNILDYPPEDSEELSLSAITPKKKPRSTLRFNKLLKTFIKMD